MNRIRQLRNDRNMKQIDLCKLLGIVQSTLSGWENGKYEPDNISLKKMSEIFSVSIDYILNNSNLESMPVNWTSEGYRIKVYGKLPAGVPLDAIGEILGWEEIPLEWISDNSEYIAMKIKGDSMSPKYLEGDTIIIKLQNDCESGQDAIVYVNGEDAVLKRIIKNMDNFILQPINHNYETSILSKNDIIKILGIVVELRRKV